MALVRLCNWSCVLFFAALQSMARSGGCQKVRGLESAPRVLDSASTRPNPSSGRQEAESEFRGFS